MKLKKALFIGLAAVVPGLGALWLVKKLSAKSNDPYDADFREYVQENFDKLKTEEHQWLQ